MSSTTIQTHLSSPKTERAKLKAKPVVDAGMTMKKGTDK